MRASTSVILAGKCGSRRHSDTSFGENLVVAKTSYQMLGILSFSDRERALPPSTEISELTFAVKNSPGCLFLDNKRENLKLNFVLVAALVIESKALYYPHCLGSEQALQDGQDTVRHPAA